MNKKSVISTLNVKILCCVLKTFLKIFYSFKIYIHILTYKNKFIKIFKTK